MKIKGGDFLQDSQNLYRKTFCGENSRQLEKGEKHVACGNFIGPGTRLDLEKVRNFKPYNNVDNCAKTHDFAYEKSFKIKDKKERMKSIRKDDEEFLRCVESFKNEEPYYTVGKNGIKLKIDLENNNPEIVKILLGDDYIGGNKNKIIKLIKN